MNNKNTEQPVCHRKPDIEYPCTWEYRVIGSDEQKITTVITNVCAPHPAEITRANLSARGTYVSLNVKIVVENEAVRTAIFEQLQNHDAVKMVL